MSDAMKTIIKAALSQLGNSCVDFFNEVSPLLLRLCRDVIDLVKVLSKLKSRAFSLDEIGEVLERSNEDLGDMLELSKRKKEDDQKAVMKIYEKHVSEIKTHPLDAPAKEKLLNKGESFVKKISGYDEYKKLNQMLSLLKSIVNKDYQDVDSISISLLALMMCLKEGDIASLSQSLELIDTLYKKHKKVLDTYMNWYMKK